MGFAWDMLLDNPHKVWIVGYVLKHTYNSGKHWLTLLVFLHTDLTDAALPI